MKLNPWISVLLVVCSTSVFADARFEQLDTLSASNFHLLVKDFTAAASYKAVGPAEPLGLTGFDIGAELTATQLKNDSIWQQAGANISVLPLPKIHVTKGLPLNMNVGLSYAAVPNSDIRLIGGEFSYAFVEGGTLMPAVAVRAGYTQLSGVDQLDLNTKSVELTASKGFLNLTPYIGIGHVWGDATAHVGSLGKTSTDADKYEGGININFGLINFAIEADRVGKDTSVNGKVGWRF